MHRHHMINGKQIPFTVEEETARDAEEAAWTSGKQARDLADLRELRDIKLTQSDWTQVGDAPLDTATKTSWATYRQALRDLPSTVADLANPTWPVKPA